MNKLRIQAVISICLLLILVLGGSSMFYFLFATDYYIGKKQTLMDAAFGNLQKLNLRQISYDDDPSINSLEAESFSIIICPRFLAYISKVDDSTMVMIWYSTQLLGRTSW